MHKHKRTYSSAFKTSRLYCTVSSSFLGILIMVLFLVAFSWLMTKFDAPAAVVSILSCIGLCVGSYSGGYIASKKRRQNGMLMGVVTGVLIFCAIFLVGIIFFKSSITFGFITKLIMTVVCAAMGGIIGVNSKHKSYWFL